MVTFATNQRLQQKLPSKGENLPEISLDQYIRWVNSLGCSEPITDPTTSFGSGVAFCNLVSFFIGKPLSMNLFPKTKHQAMENLKSMHAALSQVSRARIPNILILEDVFYGKVKAIHSVLTDLFVTFVVRDITRNSKKILAWVHKVLKHFGRQVPRHVMQPSGGFLLQDYIGLWECFEDCVSIACLVHFFNQPTASKQSANKMLQQLYLSPKTLTELRSNVEITFAVIKAAQIPLFFSEEEWIQHGKDNHLLWLQIDALYTLYSDQPIIEGVSFELGGRSSAAGSATTSFYGSSGNNVLNTEEDMVEPMDPSALTTEQAKTRSHITQLLAEIRNLDVGISGAQSRLLATEKALKTQKQQHTKLRSVQLNDEVRRVREHLKAVTTKADEEKQQLEHLESLLYLKSLDLQALEKRLEAENRSSQILEETRNRLAMKSSAVLNLTQQLEKEQSKRRQYSQDLQIIRARVRDLEFGTAAAEREYNSASFLSGQSSTSKPEDVAQSQVVALEDQCKKLTVSIATLSEQIEATTLKNQTLSTKIENEQQRQSKALVNSELESLKASVVALSEECKQAELSLSTSLARKKEREKQVSAGAEELAKLDIQLRELRERVK